MAQSQLNGVAKPDVARQLPNICYNLREKVLAFLDENIGDETLQKVQSQVRTANGVIEDALRRYGTTTSTSEPSEPQPLKALYIVSSKPFQEVEDFVATTSEEYHLDLDRYTSKMRPALEDYLTKRPEIKAIFMGTRRTDPHSEHLTHFDMTDKDWPQFMRVHPVIDWHYVEIWAFIRHLEIPFCELYNRGFTSLGGVTDTRPNPALAVDNDATKFRPAYELCDDNEERLGRDR